VREVRAGTIARALAPWGESGGESEGKS
jgi:hypothetical protein